MTAKVKSWRDVLPVHPAADLFPLMSREELLALGEDIKKHGLKHPVVTWSPINEDYNGLNSKEVFPLDGRNRLDANSGRLVRIHVFRNRLPMMHRDGWNGPRATSTTPYAWFVWNREHHGPAEVRRISWARRAGGP